MFPRFRNTRQPLNGSLVLVQQSSIFRSSLSLSLCSDQSPFPDKLNHFAQDQIHTIAFFEFKKTLIHTSPPPFSGNGVCSKNPMTHRRFLGRAHRHMETSGYSSIRNCRKLFWFVFFSLFMFWYSLLNVFDWPSFPRLSSTNLANSIQSFQSNHEHVSNHLKEIAGIKPSSQSATTVEEEEEEEQTTEKKLSGKDVFGIEDIEVLEKELDPLLKRIKAEEDRRYAIIKTEIEKEKKKKAAIQKRAVENRRRDEKCSGRYIYVHKLPGRFNKNLLKDCKSLSRWTDMCSLLMNRGVGPELGNPQRVFLDSGWFDTNQFNLEVIFHNRMSQYECLTNDSSKASAIFVPYYSGLDVSRFLWGNYSISVRDSGSVEVAKWLRRSREWKAMGGRDHFLVAGRITWDFRRGLDEDFAWGNKLMLLPESKNMTILTIESSPWNNNDFAIPYPTYFHPSSDNELRMWQNKVRRLRRRILYSFAGAPRPHLNDSIRTEITDQCLASKRKCQLLECKNNNNKCHKPFHVMKMFEDSVFCLQPPGDSFTRRSTFDSILAGCIPVFFSPGSAYVQYLWHLPRDFYKYSVLIPEGEVKKNNVSIERVLSEIPRSKILAMREEVIRLIPKVVYADPGSKLEKTADAFDLTVKGVLERVEGLRKETREGNNSSLEFDEEGSWKYYAFGTVEKHEWDHFFQRTNWIRY